MSLLTPHLSPLSADALRANTLPRSLNTGGQDASRRCQSTLPRNLHTNQRRTPAAAMAEDLSNTKSSFESSMSQIKAQEQHTINHELDAVHSWSPMSNAGWLATKGNHAFKAHELPGVKKAQYEDQKRLLTVYDKEYPSLDKRRNPQAAVVAKPRQLIASKWQTPRTRDASGNIQLQTEDVKEPTETERQLYSGRVPQSRLRQFGDTTFGGPTNHFC